MIDLSAPAKQVFEILRSYDYTVMLWDDNGNEVGDPEEARRFFARPTNMMVTVIEDGENTSIRLFIGKKTDVADVLGLINALRTAATSFNLLFNVRKYNKEIDPKDFATDAAVSESVVRTADRIIENCRKVLK